MFAKILGFSLVYILSLVNFLIVLMPMTFLFFGEVFLLKSSGNYSKSLTFLAIAIASFLMLLFLFFDFIFSFSLRYYKKTCTLCKKNKKYSIFSEIFDDIKNRFNKRNVELYISNSSEINAFAVGGLRQNIIVLTTGLLNHYSNEIKDDEKFLLAVKGIIGHEMSHIVNKDYFTALLLIVNERSLNLVSKLVLFIFNIIVRVVGIIPVVGGYFSIAISSVYKAINWIIMFFYNHLMMNIYNFIKLQVSKNVEYRADNQGAKLVGGENMAYALSLLGSSGYFTIFSTHPSTKSRIKKVRNVLENKRIRPVFGSNLTFILSFFIMIFIFTWTLNLADLQSLANDFFSMKINIINKYFILKSRFIVLLENFTTK